MVEVKEVVVTDLARRGSGKDELSPVRSVLEVYSKEGQLIALHDSLGNYSLEDLISFATLCRQKTDLSLAEVLRIWKV